MLPMPNEATSAKVANIAAMRGIFMEDQRTRDEFLRLTTSSHEPLG